jgi:hypothetical protein
VPSLKQFKFSENILELKGKAKNECGNFGAIKREGLTALIS